MTYVRKKIRHLSPPVRIQLETPEQKDRVMRIELNLQSTDPSMAPLREASVRAGERYSGRHALLTEHAREHHAALAGAPVTASVIEPLAAIPVLADLLSDPDWILPAQTRERFAGALAYFVDPDDLIPDDDSRFGYLDDALVLKLALAESRHEWFAWCDYSDHVEAYPEDAGIGREAWMRQRRERLERDLRRRHGQQAAAGFGLRPAHKGRRSFVGPDPHPDRFGVR